MMICGSAFLPSLGQVNRLVIPWVVLSMILKSGNCKFCDVQVPQVVTDLISTYSRRDNVPQSPSSDPFTQGMYEEDVSREDGGISLKIIDKLSLPPQTPRLKQSDLLLLDE